MGGVNNSPDYITTVKIGQVSRLDDGTVVGRVDQHPLGIGAPGIRDWPVIRVRDLPGHQRPRADQVLIRDSSHATASAPFHVAVPLSPKSAHG